jgi:ubiquinone/menaquinone biosynthesis C-methylase UbiE
VINCARLGAKVWGLDYSKEALLIANEIINDDKLKEVKKFMAIQRSNAQFMPFANESIDIVFMLDIVEHLNPEELNHTFSEVWRVLKYDGRVIVHTMPNLWYYRYGYPLYRFSQNILGKHLPSDPRARWKYSHVHVNEQDPHKLRKCMELCTFDARVWLKPTQNYQDEASWFIRLMMQFLSRTYPFRFVFCNDIFGVGIKRCV